MSNDRGIIVGAPCVQNISLMCYSKIGLTMTDQEPSQFHWVRFLAREKNHGFMSPLGCACQM